MGCHASAAVANGLTIKSVTTPECLEPGTSDLVVTQGESLIFSPFVDKYAPYFVRVVPRTMCEMKKLVGLPDGLHATSRSELLTQASAPMKFVGKPGPNAAATNVFARSVAKDYIYRDAATMAAIAAPIEQLLPNVTLYVAILRDLIVHQDSTLVLARGVDRITARNVTIESGGRLILQGSNVYIRARSLRGHSPSTARVVLGPATAATATIAIRPEQI